MSKLADRIRKASRPEPPPIGFGATTTARKNPSLLTVVRLSAGDAGKAGDAAARGADVVIIDGADAGKAKDALSKSGDVCIGARPPHADRRAVAALREAGADFAVLDAESALAEAMLEEKIGYVLDYRGDGDDTGLRLLGELGLDAIIVPPPPERLTLHELLKLRRTAALTRTPLLTSVKPDAEAGYLQVLLDSGVAGVIVDWSAAGKLGDLKARIESLPPRGRRREERAEAVLPVTPPHHEEEEFEDD